MKLNLKWKKDEIVFNLGELEKKDNKYIFRVNEEQLKEAIKYGCDGIGSFTFLENVYYSDELFDFFRFRIPKKDHMNIEKILAKYGLKEYDDMAILKITKARLATDNYYVEE